MAPAAPGTWRSFTGAWLQEATPLLPPARGPARPPPVDPFASIFSQTFDRGYFFRPKGAKSRKKGHPKNYVKIDAEKDEKMMPKGSQNDAKMDAKVIIFDKKSMKKSMRKSMPKKS